MKIEFTGEHKWNIDGWTSFRAIVDGKQVTNRIAMESLQDYFGSDGSRDGDEAAYQQHRASIDKIAEKMIRDGEINKYGGADLTTDAIERSGHRL